MLETLATPMQVGEIYAILDELSPFSLQASWDNSGLNIGAMGQEVESIALALELDSTMAQHLKPNTLLITHHPLLFSPLKSLDTATYPANLIATLLQKNCALIAMHTNFDHTHLNDHFSREVLGFSHSIQCDIAQYAPITPIPLEELAAHCKNALNLPYIRYVSPDNPQTLIKHLYIVCGSGASYAREITTPHSCLICGDVKYHDAMIAKSNGLSFIDVEHYASEREFAKILQSLLKIKNLSATILPNFSPFSYL